MEGRHPSRVTSSPPVGLQPTIVPSNCTTSLMFDKSHYNGSQVERGLLETPEIAVLWKRKENVFRQVLPAKQMAEITEYW